MQSAALAANAQTLLEARCLELLVRLFFGRIEAALPCFSLSVF
jgi:hypothetical protein